MPIWKKEVQEDINKLKEEVEDEEEERQRKLALDVVFELTKSEMNSRESVSGAMKNTTTSTHFLIYFFI